MKTVIVGIDVSKETLDLVIQKDDRTRGHDQLANSVKDLKNYLQSKLKEFTDKKSTWLVCMENTGIYCKHVIEVCAELQLDLWVEDAGRIKAFHSLSRGKNDALDAERIAQYAFFKQQEAKLWEAPRAVIHRLKSLYQLRKRLLNTKQRLSSPLGEETYMGDGWSKEHAAHLKPILAQLKRQLKEVESKMKEIINEDAHLQKLYSQMSSVKGVGLIVGASILVMTNEFKSINDPRKMACQCGVAPFPYESGKRIRGRTKVSHRAHKPMKVLLNLAARSSVSSPGELRDYYERKVSEGKNKMVVLNAIRNKLIHRIFACVRDGRKYEEIYTPALV
ncbi:MAG: IS110 family transposase [Cyclobacteriaceae bacterium]|uniref:IS110 family transposase n=1 Tax=Reichenbachiella sp. TaxID=2184521 RepID=UPI003263F6E8